MANYKIVISGYYGFNNAGDEAMLTAILQALRKTFINPDITVISGNPKFTADSLHVNAVPRFSISKIFSSIFRADLIISGGGSLLQDVTSWKSMIYYLSIIVLGVFFRKKVFLYSQGIGPVRYRIIRIILKHVLNHVDAITVRDKESKGFLERLGVHSKIYATADAVLSLVPANLSSGQQILKKNRIHRKGKLVGIAIRNWEGTAGWMADMRDYVKKIVSDGNTVVFIPMQHPNDCNAARAIADSLDGAYILSGEYSIEDLMSLIGNMDILIGMRLHALVFASLMHVPFLGISYDPKIDNFLALIGQKAITSVTHMNAQKLYNATCKEISADRKTEDWGKVDSLRKQALQNVQILRDLVINEEEH